MEAVPYCIGCGALDQCLLNRCIGPQDNVAHGHTILLIKHSLLGAYLIFLYLRESFPIFLLVRELSPINMALGVSLVSRGHQEGFHRNSPLRIVGSIKDGN